MLGKLKCFSAAIYPEEAAGGSLGRAFGVVDHEE